MTAPLKGAWNYPTRILAGPGRIAELADACRGAGITRPFFVTDKGLETSAIAARAMAVLRAGGLAPGFYADIRSNPVEENLDAGLALYRAGGHDGVVAFGGGSALDIAKLIAFMSGQSRPVWDFEDIGDWWTRADPAGIAPVIAVPTTAGTGSEVGRGAILILDDGRKVGVISPFVVPKVAICDPALTMGLPPMLTAATGMDAIAHCIETFLSPAFNPPADGIALDGLRRAWRHIERATRQPDDRDARLNMMSASMQGALAFQKGLGCVHSLSHSLGGIDPRLHHGTLNAIFLPAVMAFNQSAASVREDDKLDRLAQAMGLASGAEVGPSLRAMTERLGLPTGLATLGVTRAMFPDIVRGALKDHSHRTNPRIAADTDYVAMLEASL